MKQAFAFLTTNYIDQESILSQIESISAKITDMPLDKPYKDENGNLEIQIDRLEPNLIKTYNEVPQAALSFKLMSEKYYSEAQVEKRLFDETVYFANVLITYYRDSDNLFFDFLTLFMTAYPEALLLGNANTENENDPIYTIEHAEAGAALDYKDWFWINPDQVIKDYQNITT